MREMKDAAKLLSEPLAEEKETDEALTAVASEINWMAEQETPK